LLENTVLRRIFVPYKEEGWKRLHIEKLHKMYPLPNVMVIKSRRMR